MTRAAEFAELESWREIFEGWLHRNDQENDDGSHDISHFQRVARLALEFIDEVEEDVDRLVVLAAAYFHDIVTLPKNHPERSKASMLAAERSKEILEELNFPKDKFERVSHAVAAHSFSAGISPETIEAKILQDADRMEALGPIGLMRTFYTSGTFKPTGRPPYHEEDLLAERRPLDDKKYALDHFAVKLLKLQQTMQTTPGRKKARELSDYLEEFRMTLADEVLDGEVGFATKVARRFYEAGYKKLLLFDAQDPFAKKRGPNPEKYALDSLLEDPHCSPFLEKLEQQLML